MRTLLFHSLLTVHVNILCAAKPVDLVKHVNTLQGTNSGFELTCGNTYPTTVLTFAMHTWGSQTGWNGDG